MITPWINSKRMKELCLMQMKSFKASPDWNWSPSFENAYNRLRQRKEKPHFSKKQETHCKKSISKKQGNFNEGFDRNQSPFHRKREKSIRPQIRGKDGRFTSAAQQDIKVPGTKLNQEFRSIFKIRTEKVKEEMTEPIQSSAIGKQTGSSQVNANEELISYAVKNETEPTKMDDQNLTRAMSSKTVEMKDQTDGKRITIIEESTSASIKEEVIDTEANETYIIEAAAKAEEVLMHAEEREGGDESKAEKEKASESESPIEDTVKAEEVLMQTEENDEHSKKELTADEIEKPKYRESRIEDAAKEEMSIQDEESGEPIAQKRIKAAEAEETECSSLEDTVKEESPVFHQKEEAIGFVSQNISGPPGRDMEENPQEEAQREKEKECSVMSSELIRTKQFDIPFHFTAAVDDFSMPLLFGSASENVLEFIPSAHLSSDISNKLFMFQHTSVESPYCELTSWKLQHSFSRQLHKKNIYEKKNSSQKMICIPEHKDMRAGKKQTDEENGVAVKVPVVAGEYTATAVLEEKLRLSLPVRELKILSSLVHLTSSQFIPTRYSEEGYVRKGLEGTIFLDGHISQTVEFVAEEEEAERYGEDYDFQELIFIEMSFRLLQNQKIIL